MKVKPLKIKIKEPTPSAADRLYAKHQAIRKKSGLPDPSEYKKKLEAMKKEEVEQLDELSPATKASYVSKAKEQIKQSEPWTKKGEYKDIAKNFIAKRQKGIDKASKVEEAVKLGGTGGRGNIYQYDRNPPPKDGSELENVPFRAKTEKQKKLQNALNDLGNKMKKTHPKLKENTELDEQLYKKARFVSGPAKKPFKSNTVASPMSEGENKQVKGGDPCWKGYQMVGKKKKNGREVPNCVPVNEDSYEPIESHATLSRKAQIVKDAFKSKKDKQNAKDEASDKFQSEPELSSAIHKT